MESFERPPRSVPDPGRGLRRLQGALLFACWTWTLLTLRRELTRTARLSAGRQDVRLSWLWRWLLAFVALATLLYGLFFVNAYEPVVPLDSDDFASFILAVMIDLVSLMVLLRPWVLSVRPRRRHGERHAAEARRLEEWWSGSGASTPALRTSSAISR